jgi:hypothetical protein
VADDGEGLTPPARLVEMAEKRRAEQVGRLAAYSRYLAQYFQVAAGEAAGNAALANYSDGRPALRAPGENAFSRSHRASPNYIKHIVDDLVAIRGSWPAVTVPAASGDPAARDRAVLITRALREQHEHSAMVRQQQRAGFFLSCLGDACYTLDPRLPEMEKTHPDPFRPVGVYFQVVNPLEAFPKFAASQDQELQDLFWMVTISREEARDQFPDIRLKDAEEKEPVTVIHYYSRKERQTIVDGTRAFGIRHDLGFCPAEWICNKATDGRWAQSDIAGCADLHEELQDIWKVYVDTLVSAAYPIIHIHDAQQSQGQVELGPGAQFSTTGTGKIELLAPQANPQAAALIFESSLDNLMKQAGIAPIRIEGQIDRSNVSAKSVDRQQAPMEQRLKLSLDLLGQGLQRLNAKCLLMLSKVPELAEAPMELYGQDREGTYHETFTGQEIGGWTRNVVSWDTMTGQSPQERLAGRLQLYKEGGGLFPFEEVISSAGYDDPKEVMDRGMAEAKERQAMMPQGAPGPGGPPPGGPGQGHEHFAGEHAGGAGAPVQPPPAAPPVPGPGGPGGPKGPMPGFPPIASPPNARGLGSPAPVPPILDAIDAALQKLPMRGTFQVVARNNTWTVRLSDHRDAAQVNAALKPIEAQMGVRVKVDVVGEAVANSATQR